MKNSHIVTKRIGYNCKTRQNAKSLRKNEWG